MICFWDKPNSPKLGLLDPTFPYMVLARPLVTFNSKKHLLTTLALQDVYLFFVSDYLEPFLLLWELF